MLESMSLKNFKGFVDTQIPHFAKVNIVLGGQNVGKTSLLEAIFLVAGGHQRPNKLQRNSLPNIFRQATGGEFTRYWSRLLGVDNKKDIEVELFISRVPYCVSHGNKYPSTQVFSIYNQFSLNFGSDRLNVFAPSIDFQPETFSVFPVSSQERVRQYGVMVTARQKKHVIELLRKIEPRLEDIENAAPDGEHRIYVGLTKDSEMLSIDQLGQGFGRLLHIYNELATSDSKLALIDEVENGIHYQSLPIVMKGIRSLCEQRDMQTVMTTHSWECIRAACDAFVDKPEDFQAIRLERDGDNIKAVCIAGQELIYMVERGYEVR